MRKLVLTPVLVVIMSINKKRLQKSQRNGMRGDMNQKVIVNWIKYQKRRRNLLRKKVNQSPN